MPQCVLLGWLIVLQTSKKPHYAPLISWHSLNTNHSWEYNGKVSQCFSWHSPLFILLPRSTQNHMISCYSLDMNHSQEYNGVSQQCFFPSSKRITAQFMSYRTTEYKPNTVANQHCTRKRSFVFHLRLRQPNELIWLTLHKKINKNATTIFFHHFPIYN